MGYFLSKQSISPTSSSMSHEGFPIQAGVTAINSVLESLLLTCLAKQYVLH